jgi:hypothetical protein
MSGAARAILVLTKNDEYPTSFTLVGNSADSRGLADVTPCIATPNASAHRPERATRAPVRCSGLFGDLRPLLCSVAQATCAVAR